MIKPKSTKACTRPMTAKSEPVWAAGAGRQVQRHDGADDEDQEQRSDQLRDVGGEPSILHFSNSSSSFGSAGGESRHTLDARRRAEPHDATSVRRPDEKGRRVAGGRPHAGRLSRPAARTVLNRAPRKRRPLSRLPAQRRPRRDLRGARRGGYFEERGIELEIREPSASTDAPKLLAAGRAEFAILDIHDLGSPASAASTSSESQRSCSVRSAR